MISSSRLAELQHVPPAWKFCAVQSQERFVRENAQRADRHKWKTTARPQKHCPAARIEATKKKNKRGRSRAGTTSCLAAPTGVTSCGQHAGLRARVVVLEGHRTPINPNLDSNSKTDLETCGKYRELKRKLLERALTQRKARAREEPSPGPPASETDAGPPGHQPRGGAPARPRLSRGQEGPT